MSLGKQIRLNRIFSHPSGRLCSVALDHFTIYNIGLPPGLRAIKQSLSAIMTEKPDAVTIHKGIASALWGEYAGQIPLIKVDVEGAVAKPGIVEVPLGSRAQDAITAAGGATDKADISQLNQAQVLNDGQQIIVAEAGQTVVQPTDGKTTISLPAS